MRTRRNGGDRIVIPDEEANAYFIDPETGATYDAQKIADAVNRISNTTSTFERYLLNSISSYNAKEGLRNGFKYCNTSTSGIDKECIQRGARMKKAFQMFADLPPQAYFHFKLVSILNQGVNATKDMAKDTTVAAKSAQTSMSNAYNKYFKAGNRTRKMRR